jgi:hypothetical protein
MVQMKFCTIFYNEKKKMVLFNKPSRRHAELVSASIGFCQYDYSFRRCRNKFGMTCRSVVFFTKLFCSVINTRL